MMLTEAFLILAIAVFAAFITHRRSTYTKIIGTALLTYLMFFIYWAIGICSTGQYEPDMLIGWLFISTVANFIVIPLAYIFSYILLNRKPISSSN